MKKTASHKSVSRFLILLTIVIILSACSQSSSSPTTTASSTDESASLPDEGGGTEADPYTVDLSPADFVSLIDNPYLPFIPGTSWVYEATLDDGSTERIEVEVQSEPRLVMGVTATVVRDSVYEDGELIEDTFDWYAQDKDGNVWYLGEDVDNYEEGVLVDHEGAWEWGVDGALPGILMWADPENHLDEEYYQEYYVGEAEDMGQVLSVSDTVTVPVGSYDEVVKTLDFSALDPANQAHKYYAQGVGVVKEVELSAGEEVELIEFKPAADSG